MPKDEEKDGRRTVANRASNDDAQLEADDAVSTGGDGPSENGPRHAEAAARASRVSAAAQAGTSRPAEGTSDEDPGAASRGFDPSAAADNLGAASRGFDPNAAAGADSLESQQDLTRRERERLVRRQLMLDAARAVFAEKGYADATLDEVAAPAEFGKGTLYNYFESGKEEILFAIFDDLYDALCRLVDATLSPELVRSSPFRQVFEGFLTAIFAFFLDRHDQFMILMKEGHRMMFSDQPEKALYFQKQGERVIDVMMKGIEAAQAKGELRAFPSIAIANMIMGNVKGYHMHRCMEGCREAPDGLAHREMSSPEDSARFLSTFLLDGMLAHPEA